LLSSQTRLNRHHPTSDIDTNRCWNNGSKGWNNAANGRPFAQMHVWHSCDPLVNKGQLGNIAQLLSSLSFKGDAPSP
jgi:hypothetical protein